MAVLSSSDERITLFNAATDLCNMGIHIRLYAGYAERCFFTLQAVVPGKQVRLRELRKASRLNVLTYFVIICSMETD